MAWSKDCCSRSGRMCAFREWFMGPTRYLLLINNVYLPTTCRPDHWTAHSYCSPLATYSQQQRQRWLINWKTIRYDTGHSSIIRWPVNGNTGNLGWRLFKRNPFKQLFQNSRTQNFKMNDSTRNYIRKPVKTVIFLVQVKTNHYRKNPLVLFTI